MAMIQIRREMEIPPLPIIVSFSTVFHFEIYIHRSHTLFITTFCFLFTLSSELICLCRFGRKHGHNFRHRLDSFLQLFHGFQDPDGVCTENFFHCWKQVGRSGLSNRVRILQRSMQQLTWTSKDLSLVCSSLVSGRPSLLFLWQHRTKVSRLCAPLRVPIPPSGRARAGSTCGL